MILEAVVEMRVGEKDEAGDAQQRTDEEDRRSGEAGGAGKGVERQHRGIGQVAERHDGLDLAALDGAARQHVRCGRIG